MERKSTNRIDKVNAVIQQLLGTVLLEFFKDGKAIVTVSKVECSKDLRWVKAWISIANADNDQAIMAKLQHHLFEIQGELNRNLAMKIVPRVQFYLDTSARYAEKMGQIFRQIEVEREGKEADQDVTE